VADPAAIVTVRSRGLSCVDDRIEYVIISDLLRAIGGSESRKLVGP